MPKRHNGFASFQDNLHPERLQYRLRIVQKELPGVLRNSVAADREGPGVARKAGRHSEKGALQCGLRHVPLPVETRNPPRF